jgi:hypothetical protein
MSDLQPYLTAFHRKSIGLRADPAHTDFLAAFRADPDLVTQAKTIIASLKNEENGILKRDHESRVRLRCAQRMLSQYEAQA